MTENNDKSGTDGNQYQRPDGDASALDQEELDKLADSGPSSESDTAVAEQAAREDLAPEEPVHNEPAAVVQKMPSKIPGYLGLLLGLGALGLAGYLYWLTQLQDPLAPFEKRIDEIATRAESNSGKVSSETDALRQELQTAIQTATRSQDEAADSLRSEIASQQENLEAAQAALAESLGETINAQPPTDRDWQLAEAQYLLRIANHRLLMERDAVMAGQLLASADNILAEVGDFSLFDVRARLADEILSLKALTGTDLQGLYLQIEALKKAIETLPARVPEYLQKDAPALDADPDAVAAAAEAGDAKAPTVWQEIGSRLSAFYQYRKVDGSETREALLSPDQSIYLEMNLRLMLERAQLALMRRNQLIYEQSLATAEEWVGEYFDSSAPSVTQAQSQLAELLEVNLELPIPDISGSLTALQAVSRGSEE